MVTAVDATGLDRYQLRLPGYEGPLDVLLRLIERDQMEITDVSLVAVTRQFLDHMRTLTEAPVDVVASFTTVGTRLTVLKTRSLLPRPASADPDEPESDLTRHLMEYRRARDTAAFLARRATLDLRAYGPGIGRHTLPGAIRRPEHLAAYDASTLVRLLRRRLTVVPKPTHSIPRRRLVTLGQTVARIVSLVQGHQTTRFVEVIAPYRTRAEVATAFLGLLVLVRRNAVVAEQTDLFGDIHLHAGTADAATLDIERATDGQH